MALCLAVVVLQMKIKSLHARTSAVTFMLARESQCTSEGSTMARIIVQVTIYRRPRIGRDGHLDQSEAYDIL